MICILETRIKETKHQHIIQTILPGWNFSCNYRAIPSGQIWWLWDPSSYHVAIEEISDQTIHGSVLHAHSYSLFSLTIVYQALL